MLKAKYWITSGLLLIVLNFMAFVAHYISQALMQIFNPFKEWILYYLFSLILTLFVNFAILCYFHLWLRERKIKINLDWQFDSHFFSLNIPDKVFRALSRNWREFLTLTVSVRRYR